MIPLVLTQYVEEAALLWVRRDYACGQPHIDLQDVVQIDDRIVAQIDGLRLAGDDGWFMCEEQLAWGEPGEVFIATVMALESSLSNRKELAWNYAFRSPSLRANLADTLGWLPHERVASVIDELASGEAMHRSVALQASMHHGRNEPTQMEAALSSSDPGLKGCAVTCVGRLGLTEHTEAIRTLSQHPDSSCQDTAAWSLALLTGDRRALQHLKSAYASCPEGVRDTMAVVFGQLDNDEAEAWVDELVSNSEQARDAIIACGIQGRVSRVPWLLDRLSEPEHARLAGEALQMITGIDVTDSEFEGEYPSDFETGPSDDPADEDTEMDPDENLPWPDRQAISNWWVKYRTRFEAGVRYSVGRPGDTGCYEDVLRRGTQRQRAIAALELAMLEVGRPVFNVRAPGDRQKLLLTSAR